MILQDPLQYFLQDLREFLRNIQGLIKSYPYSFLNKILRDLC